MHGWHHYPILNYHAAIRTKKKAESIPIIAHMDARVVHGKRYERTRSQQLSQIMHAYRGEEDRSLIHCGKRCERTRQPLTSIYS